MQISRRRAREVALQILFRDDFHRRLSGDQRGSTETPHPGDSSELPSRQAARQVALDRAFLQARLGGQQKAVDFAQSLVDGVRRHASEIDHLLERHATNWSLERLAKIDRNILRLGCYEMLHGGTPAAVAIDEAIEVGKRYGTEESGRFINGILDRIRRETASGLTEAGDKQTPIR